jgi:GH25 family lysozyme M1 (1,4-beta-N-acetylmuramidase)
MVGVMGSALRQTAQLTSTLTQTAVSPSSASLQGVDVSYYQGSAQNPPTSINWCQVAQSGRAFAYARAADGYQFIDPDFQINYTGIKQIGMKAGAYLFFRPEQDPTAQANTLVTSLQQASFDASDLPPVFDVEVTDGQSASTIVVNLQTAITVVQQSLGVTPAIYTSWGFWNYSVGSTAFGTDPLWVANWFVASPTLPIGWSTWVIWQYNDNSTVPGITGSVDGDQSNGLTLPVYNLSSATGSLLPASRAAGATVSVRAYLPRVSNQSC